MSAAKGAHAEQGAQAAVPAAAFHVLTPQRTHVRASTGVNWPGGHHGDTVAVPVGEGDVEEVPRGEAVPAGDVDAETELQAVPVREAVLVGVGVAVAFPV